MTARSSAVLTSVGACGHQGKDASSFYRAAINSDGHVALAWSDADKYDRVVVRQLDGTWTRYPKVPVFHTGNWQLTLPEPRALFLDDAGRASTITWGNISEGGDGIWLAREDKGGGWTTQLIQSGGWVSNSHASYASNPRGDIVAITGERDASGGWPAELRFAKAGHRLGEPTTFSDYPCFGDSERFCTGVAIADDGTATVAYPRSVGGEDIVIEVVRRARDGSLEPAQAVTGEFWQNSFDDIEVTGNGPGDAVVSFTGRSSDDSSIDIAFARCPATTPR